ncbi:hypothetical protein [Streptomyces sp. BPTC-684]|uniref:hypothetical protein n=1 Tax=Streptomyces sp. BPTC-684 TaxID=3043734 RepID=UPI0024B21BFA|nr:hypothetical protein [Streptomyces sp. BPTC-684]WHM41051.1 hypothetical protein QIY60_32095 [Streptomyces sp. BPTC-684]
MPRLLTVALTAVLAAALAIAVSFGIVALLGIPPDQPNDPLVTFPVATPASGTP